jgi:hypothetical protein
VKILFKWALLSATAIAFVLGGQSLAAETPFKVTIKADGPTVKAGGDALIQVTITNTSKRAIEYAVSYNRMLAMDTLDKYDVLPKGAATPVQKNVVKHLELAGGSLRPPVIIKPGETKVVGTDVISVLYNLSRPGQYSVQLLRPVSSNPKDGIVKSNAITVTVTE